jgi:heme a synthase
MEKMTVIRNRLWLNPYQRHTVLAFVTFALAFAVILLGAYTRLTDAGLSCPDWPHCFGYLTAPHTKTQLQQVAQHYPGIEVNTSKAWTEMIHRYAAGLEGILILILVCSLLFTTPPPTQHKPFFISVLLSLLLGVQVTLGMLTVTAKLKPIIVLGHLLTGLSLLTILWWTSLHLCQPFISISHRSKLTPWLWIGFMIIALQIALGGWVSTHDAGLICPDFPYCQGQVMPTLHWSQLNSDLITIHMLHRIGALITLIYIGLLGLQLLRHTRFRFIGGLLLTILILQITLGMINILWWRPVSIALIHHLMAVMLLLTSLTALYKVHGRAHSYDS